MDIRADAWLGGILGKDVFRVNASEDADALRAHAEGRTAFYYAKVDVADVRKVRALARVGCFPTDVNVTFAAAPNDIRGGDGAPGVAIAARTAELDAGVLDIAESTFKYTRFHLDPLVADAHANTIKREWVANYARGVRGDHLFVATLEGRAAGFLAALRAGEGGSTAVIDLVGTGQHAQRRGVARAMIGAFARHYEGCQELVVGTQAANIPSCRLYESMGFRLKKNDYVMHLHVENGRAL